MGDNTNRGGDQVTMPDIFHPTPRDREVEMPNIKPSLARKPRIENNLGSTTGWQFIEYVFVNETETRHCDVSGVQLRTKGVKLYNSSLDKYIVCGTGVATTYTDAVIPTLSEWDNMQNEDNIEATKHIREAHTNLGDVLNNIP